MKTRMEIIAILANRIFENGFAFDFSEAFKYAHAGENEEYYFSITRSKGFVAEKKSEMEY